MSGYCTKLAAAHFKTIENDNFAIMPWVSTYQRTPPPKSCKTRKNEKKCFHTSQKFIYPFKYIINIK